MKRAVGNCFISTSHIKKAPPCFACDMKSMVSIDHGSPNYISASRLFTTL